MIMSFRHKGLASFFSTGSKSGIQAHHEKKLRLILGRLAVARELRDMNLPGLRMHPLSGDLNGYIALDVSGNWRIVFRFEGNDVADVDYLDYH
ncbi:MAG TPA: peptidase [Desulfuromonadales bacterium]|nr:peptidase [Desulfuromonadales bacterium]